MNIDYEPNAAACFVHEISTSWEKQWCSLLADDGCQKLAFSRGGNFCAMLGGAQLSLWDTRITNHYANSLDIPSSLQLSGSNAKRCNNLVWSEKSDQIALSFVPKRAKNTVKINLQYTSDLMIVDVRTCKILHIYRLPFLASYMTYLPSSSDSLVISNLDNSDYSVVGTSNGKIRIVTSDGPLSFRTRSEHQLPTYVMEDTVTNTSPSCTMPDSSLHLLEFWSETYAELLNSNLKESSAFISVTDELCSKFESSDGSGNPRLGYILKVEDNSYDETAVALAKISTSSSSLHRVTARQSLPVGVLDSLVFSVYLDTEKYNVLLCSSCNAIIVSATDLTCTWSFKDSLTTTIYTCDQLFGGGFIPVDRAILEREKERKMAKSEHSSKLAVGFAYQGGDMRFHKQIQIIDVYGNQEVETIHIPRGASLDFVHLDSCPKRPLLLAQTNGDQLYYLRQNLITDFAGSMYPSGFKIMKAVKAYVENEDELDKVVHNENKVLGASRVVSASFSIPTNGQGGDEDICLAGEDMEVQLVEDNGEEDDVDFFTLPTTSPPPSSSARSGREDIVVLPFSTYSGRSLLTQSSKSSKRKLMEQDGAATATATTTTTTTTTTIEPSNPMEGKLCIDDVRPIPMSIKAGTFAAKILKEKRLAEDTEKVRLRKSVIDEKVSQLDKLYKDEVVKRKERLKVAAEKAERERVKKEENAKIRLEKLRVQKIETAKRQREREVEKKEKEVKERREKKEREAEEEKLRELREAEERKARDLRKLEEKKERELKKQEWEQIFQSGKVLEGGCLCGKVQYDSVIFRPLWGRFCCHCSMCPAEDKVLVNVVLGYGVNFVPVPRVNMTEGTEEGIKKIRSSAYAQRWRCEDCDTGLLMRYDGEFHTDWVQLNTLDVASREFVLRTLPLPMHIHCNDLVPAGTPRAKGALANDGSRMYRQAECWEPDPCRPPGTEPPEICNKCWIPVVKSEEIGDKRCMCI